MGKHLSISFNKDIGANDKCFLFIFKVIIKKKKPTCIGQEGNELRMQKLGAVIYSLLKSVFFRTLPFV